MSKYKVQLWGEGQDYRIACAGELGVGKSVLVQQFVRGCPGEVDPEVEDSVRKVEEIDGEKVLLDLLDVVPYEYAQPPFSLRQRDNWLRGSDGMVLVYDVTSRVSFDRLIGSHQAWIDRWCRSKGLDSPDGLPLILVANKIDLVTEGGGDRVVSREEGEELARTYGYAHFETSARTGMNVDQVFEACVRLIKAKRIEEEEEEEEAARAKKKCRLM